VLSTAVVEKGVCLQGGMFQSLLLFGCCWI